MKFLMLSSLSCKTHVVRILNGSFDVIWLRTSPIRDDISQQYNNQMSSNCAYSKNNLACEDSKLHLNVGH